MWKPLILTLCYLMLLGQPEGEGVLLQPEYLHLHGDMWARQKRAMLRASEAAKAEAAALLEACRGPGGIPELTEQPAYVTGGQLFPHQLSGVNWLRRQWVGGGHAVLADDSGMGKTATAVAYLQCLM